MNLVLCLGTNGGLEHFLEDLALRWVEHAVIREMGAKTGEEARTKAAHKDRKHFRCSMMDGVTRGMILELILALRVVESVFAAVKFKSG
jgi:hypothetical protein